MLNGREKEDIAGVWWVEDGVVGVESGWIWEGCEVEAREVVHGVFSLVVKTLL